MSLDIQGKISDGELNRTLDDRLEDKLEISIAPDQSLLQQLKTGTIPIAQLLELMSTYRLMPRLVRELVIDEAIASIDCTPDETLAGYQQFYSHHKIQSPDDRGKWLQSNGMKAEQLHYLIQRDLRIEKFKIQTWDHQLESYFLKRKSQLDRVIYSLIRTQDFAIAQELFFRIQEGERSFADLAKEYSQGKEAQTHGIIGPVELSVPHPMLAQALAHSQPGQLIPPMKIQDWIVMARVEEFLPTQLDDATRTRLREELFDRWLQEEMITAVDQ